MAKSGIMKTLAGLAVIGAAIGGAVVYLKKCKDVNDLSEEDFDDLFEDEDHADATERTYTTIPTESDTEETPAEDDSDLDDDLTEAAEETAVEEEIGEEQSTEEATTEE